MTRSLAAILDDGRFSPYRLLIVLMCAALGLIDGYDTQAIAFLAPAIKSDWGLTSAQFAPVFVANAVGALCGAVPLGMVSDRIGRKSGILLGVAVAIVGTGASPLAASVTELAVLRFIGGLGLGSVLSPLIALTSEYAPARARRFAVTAMFSSFPLGAVLGAVATSALVGPENWRNAFWIGAALPTILLPIAALVLPESAWWLAQRGRTSAVCTILARLGSSDWDGRAPSARADGTPLRAIFNEGRWPGTAFLSAACFASLLVIYLSVYWVPIITVSSGATLRGGALASAALNLAGIIGGLVIAKLADARGTRIVALAYATGTLCLAFVGCFPSSTITITISVLVIGLFCIGAQMTLLAIASGHYPVEIRTTGVAFVGAWGKLGAVAGPLLGGVIAGTGDPARGLVVTVAAAAAVAALCVAAAGRPARLVGACIS